jgi:hypothetical protein
MTGGGERLTFISESLLRLEQSYEAIVYGNVENIFTMIKRRITTLCLNRFLMTVAI